MSEEQRTEWTEHYAVNLAYCVCGERLIDDHVRHARAAELRDAAGRSPEWYEGYRAGYRAATTPPEPTSEHPPLEEQG